MSYVIFIFTAEIQYTDLILFVLIELGTCAFVIFCKELHIVQFRYFSHAHAGIITLIQIFKQLVLGNKPKNLSLNITDLFNQLHLVEMNIYLKKIFCIPIYKHRTILRIKIHVTEIWSAKLHEGSMWLYLINLIFCWLHLNPTRN